MLQNKEKKNVIIVESLPNLLIAILIREMLKNEKFDLVISSDQRSLKLLFEKNRFEHLFDKTYCANNNAINSFKKKFTVLRNARKGLSYYLGEEVEEQYSDLFFWNPSEFFFVFYASLRQNNSIHLHVYTDSFGGYILDSPDSSENDYNDEWRGNYHIFKKGLWDCLFKTKYHIPYIRDDVFDFYMCKPELSVIQRTHSVTEVPWFNVINNLELINYAFDYDKDTRINAKWVLLTNVLGERRSSDIEERVFRSIISTLPNSEMVIKPHPRQDPRFFENINIPIIYEQFPLELFFLNNEVDDYIFISDESSAIFLSTLVFEKKTTVIWLRGLYKDCNLYCDELWRYYINMMNNNGCRCYEPHSEKELIRIIRDLMDL